MMVACLFVKKQKERFQISGTLGVVKCYFQLPKHFSHWFTYCQVTIMSLDHLLFVHIRGGLHSQVIYKHNFIAHAICVYEATRSIQERHTTVLHKDSQTLHPRGRFEGVGKTETRCRLELPYMKFQSLVAEHFCNPTCSTALISLSCKIIFMKVLFCCVFTVCVYYFCRFWISKYGLEFKKDVKLVSLLNQFSEIVDCKGDKSVIDNSNM